VATPAAWAHLDLQPPLGRLPAAADPLPLELDLRAGTPPTLGA
jgi:hypothetical protein